MRRTVLALVVLGLAACGSSTVEGGRDGGFKRDTGGGDDGGEIILTPPDAGGGSQADTGWVDPCPPEAKLIYLVDSDDTFSSFDPVKLKSGGDPFTDLGRLDCPAGSASPFSMSVDRQAVAWVLYSDGKLYSVNTRTLACSATGYAPRADLKLFGMGFVSDAPGSLAETLFVAGGVSPSSGSSTLATLQLAPGIQLHDIGTIAGNPELTGTGDARLWGFFPDLDPPKVSQIDKASGRDLGTPFTASAIAGRPNAWAFAFWGGDFFIFLKRDSDSSTKVHRMSSKDGTLTTPLPNTGRTIVGAGVSTCAPTEPT